MRRHLFTQLARSRDAAVAPTVALSLFGLIAVGGIAFDYARMATLDTELQAAADQAALAAATQLDGKTGAITRATAAAQNWIGNNSIFANGTAGPGKIGIQTPVFYSSYTSPIVNTVTTVDAEARFVGVSTEAREAVFALTPIVAALSSGDLVGHAVAGLHSAICNVPPLMMCNPMETAGNLDLYASTAWVDQKGRGLRLSADEAAGIGPGNFGFLNTNLTKNAGGGAAELKVALSWDNLPMDCVSTDEVVTKPGLMGNAVLPYINVRFDIKRNGNECPNLPGGKSGTCSPAKNVRKDQVLSNNCSWSENPYPNNSEYNAITYPSSPARYIGKSDGTTLDDTVTPKIMGLPRDLCHAMGGTGNCANGRLGTGDWDINAYWRSNHGGANYDNSLGAKPSRYDVYKSEIGSTATKTGYGSKVAYTAPQNTCLAPGISDPEKRRMSVAIVNCNAQNGKINGTDTVKVAKWVDVFMVEPSVDRERCTPKAGKPGQWDCVAYTPSTDVYFEVLGETPATTGGGGKAIRRSVPYLIE
jgi:Flp pilus assembly protein TadG